MIRHNKTFAFFFFYCFLLLTAKSQIVNIESARIQSGITGWLGNAGGSFSLTKNSQQVFSADLHAHVQYKSAKSLYLLLGSYD